MFYIKFDFKNKRDRWLFPVFLAASIGFFALTLFGTLKTTTQPFVCAACHEMKPEYQTWRVSSHSAQGCSACHLDKGLQGLWEYEKALVKRLQKHFQGKIAPPITLTKTIPQERCLQCHTTHRKATPRGDIIIPHDKHQARKITCTECHSGVAHGNIASRGVTEDKPYTSWTPAVAAAEMGPRQTGISMEECLECHNSMGVKTTCEDCHGVIRKPQSHYQGVFATGHGKMAQQDLQNCNKCHSYSKTFVSVDTGEPINEVGQYARENNFCVQCHLKRPAGHTRDWRNTHGKLLGSMKNRTGCLVCHDENTRNKASRAAQPSCNDCHGNKHSDSWKKTHPGRVSRLEFSKACFQCHPTSICGKCHTTENLR